MPTEWWSLINFTTVVAMTWNILNQALLPLHFTQSWVHFVRVELPHHHSRHHLSLYHPFSWVSTFTVPLLLVVLLVTSSSQPFSSSFLLVTSSFPLLSLLLQFELSSTLKYTYFFASPFTSHFSPFASYFNIYENFIPFHKFRLTSFSNNYIHLTSFTIFTIFSPQPFACSSIHPVVANTPCLWRAGTLSYASEST